MEPYGFPVVFLANGKATAADCRAGGRSYMSIGTIILIILIIALLGGFSGVGGGPFYGTGYYGGGGLGLLFVILFILLLLCRGLTAHPSPSFAGRPIVKTAHIS